MLEVSYRQVKRLWQRYREEGAKGLQHRSAGRSSDRAKPEKFRRTVLRLIREKYSGTEQERFGPTLAAEHLADEDGLEVGEETTSFHTTDQLCRMKRLSPTPTLRVLLRATSLSAFPPNRSLRSASLTTLLKVLCRRSQLIGPSCCVLRPAAQPPRTPRPLLPIIEFA